MKIKSPALITSHAIPPQAYLTAPPVCIHYKSKNAPPRRYTYAALRNELAGERNEIQCFQETLSASKGDSQLSNTTIVKSTTKIGAKNNSVIFVDSVVDPSETGGNSQHGLLVIQERGAISRYSADLSEQKWTTSLQQLTQGEVIYPAANIKERLIKHAFCISGADAALGMLKDRADLLASLNPAGSSDTETLERTALLCVLSRSNSERIAKLGMFDFDIFTLQSRIQGLSRPPMRLLVRWQLPQLSIEVKQDTSKSLLKYNAATGTFHQLVDGTLVTYEFTALGPKITTEIRLPRETINSFFPLRNGLALVATTSSYSLVNFRYKSIQASIPASSADTMQPSSRKRKRANSIVNANRPALFTRLLDYFPRENIVVGISGNDLISLPIRLPATSRTQHSANGSRLIDSLGRGIPNEKPGRVAPQLPTSSNISTFATSDRSLTKITRLLIDRQPMALSGAVEATKHLLRSFNTPRPAAVPQTYLLTNGVNGNAPNGVNHAEDDATADIVALEDAALTADLAHAVALLSGDSLDARGKALKAAISLLGTTFPAQDVARAMREQLSRRDMMFLIELLRVDLEQGGWTSHVLDMWPGEADDEEKGDDGALAVVAKVLTRAVDALGMGAWLTAANQESDTEEADADAMSIDEVDGEAQTSPARTYATVTALREEIGAVLECAQEAAWFSNFLFDFVRYENVARTSFKPTIATAAGLSKTISVAPNITATTTTSGEALVKELMLPLGVRAAKGVESTVVRAGGVVEQRSKRETGIELSKRVGEYSFERIRV